MTGYSESQNLADDLIGLDEIKEISDQISGTVNELNTLEVFLRQDGAHDIHLCYNKEKESNISQFLKYVTFRDNQSSGTQGLGCEYQNCKFIYNTHTVEDDGSNSMAFILISSGGETKKGMVVIVDGSNAIFIATCPVENLRILNYNLYKVLYPKDN